MVGLSTAWFLQERGVEVTVIEKTAVAAGSSWGNAGWIMPSIAVPLADPGVLKYGLRAIFDAASPVYVPPTINLRTVRFLVGFALHCTHAHWNRSMRSLIPLNTGALAAWAHLEHSGVAAQTSPAEPLTAAFRSAADATGLLTEFEHIRAAGQDVDFEIVDGAAARAQEPALSREVGLAVRVRGDRFVHPANFVGALAQAVRERGGVVREGVGVQPMVAGMAGAPVRVGDEEFDAVVLATGAWLDENARDFGVRRIVQAGRGYSFTVPIDSVPQGPVYFPAQRVACTPVGDRLRVAGMMEFRPVAAPMDPRRIAALIDQGSQLLAGAHFEQRRDEWVGGRPCTADGLPLIGGTRDPRVFVAGGHGMWGITLGPVTGQLLAEQIATGQAPEALRGVDPLR
jgi:D-amino-acid dehydrogenase